MNIDDQYLVASRAISKECDYEDIAHRVIDVDPNEGRCLIENTDINIQFFHVLPREAMNNDNLMNSLEWSWNMRRGELNLDTAFNILPVSASVKAKLETGEWILLPEKEILDQCQESTLNGFGFCYRRRHFPKWEPKQIFTYTLFSTRGDDLTAILRKSDDPSDKPFTFVSHIRPEFVISSAGYNWIVRGNRAIGDNMASNPLLHVMVFTYHHWAESVGLQGNVEKTYTPQIGPSLVSSRPNTPVGREFRLNEVSQVEFDTLQYPPLRCPDEPEWDSDCEEPCSSNWVECGPDCIECTPFTGDTE